MNSSDRLLLVEDSPDDVELTLMALQEVGIAPGRVTIARDGVEALELLTSPTRQPFYPALMLLDLNMPRMGGLEVLQRLQSTPLAYTLPTVVLTTSNEERDRLESYRLGCNSYVQKPVSYDQFLEAVDQIGRYWLQLNTPPPLIPMG
jgi:two-component system response regulator